MGSTPATPTTLKPPFSLENGGFLITFIVFSRIKSSLDYICIFTSISKYLFQSQFNMSNSFVCRSLQNPAHISSRCKFPYSLILLAQPRNFVIHLDYSPRKSPIISLTGRFTAQIRHVIFAWIPFDHMFAHRQRKTCPPGKSPGGQVLFRVTQPLGSIAFWPGMWSSCVPVACFLRSAAAPLLRYPYRFLPQLSAASHL